MKKSHNSDLVFTIYEPSRSCDLYCNMYTIYRPYVYFTEQEYINRGIRSTKRPYLGDYNNFTTVFGARNLSVQFAKAGLSSLSIMMLEIQKLEIENMKNEIDNPELVKEYDYEAALDKYIPMTIDKAVQFTVTSFIRKVYELIAIVYLPAKAADKLTKDVFKSCTRKLQKFTYSKAMSRILWTSLNCNILTYLSLFTFDTVSNALKVIRSKKYESIKYYIDWIGKRIIFYSVCCGASAIGFTLGSNFYPSTGGLIGGLLVESVVASIACHNLSITM